MAGTTGFSALDETHLPEICDQVKERYRLADFDNLISIPLDTELEFAIFDALADINGQPPETSFSLDGLMTAEENYKYRKLLYQGSAVHILTTLRTDWANNGLDASVASGEIEIPNRYQDLASEVDTLSTTFYERLERYKEASEKYAVGISQSRAPNHIFGTPNARNGITGSNGRLY